MLVGAHVSISGGLDKAIDRGVVLGATAIQSFASSPRTVHFTPVSEMMIDTYLKKKTNSSIQLHVFHGIYLINLAHHEPGYVRVCVDSLIGYQQLAAKIGGLGTVFHVGSHKGMGLQHYLKQIAAAIGDVITSSPPEVWLLLENAAGQQGTIGERFADLQTIIGAVQASGVSAGHLGIGLDTQHAFAAGYDLRTQTGLDTLVTDINQTVGLDKLKLVHLNDSAMELASHKDRHANLGEGKIGHIGLARVINHPDLSHQPFIIEVPGDRDGARPKDVATLKSYRTAPPALVPPDSIQETLGL